MRTSLLLLITMFCLAGCAADRPLQIGTPPNVTKPPRSAVVFFVDGLGQRQFDEYLAAGKLPNIRRHLADRAVRVEKAVSCIPTITYANAVSFLTGRYPGRHGILSNRWFEPSTGKFQNYLFIRSYELVNNDFRVPTIYEIAPQLISVNIQAAAKRGCTHSIDNWATSGINWFFGNYSGVNCLVAQAFELVGTRSAGWTQWPNLIFTYFPSPDHLGHEYGPDSAPYQDTLVEVDRQIGRICQGLIDVGMYDQTYLCLVSDHGMIHVQPDQVFDIAQLIRTRTGSKVWSNQPTEGAEAQLLRNFDYVVATCASRWCAVYPLPSKHNAPNAEIAVFSQALDKLEKINPDHENHTPVPPNIRDSLPAWLREAVAHPSVELMACSFRRGFVHLFTRDGYALVMRTTAPFERHTLWQQPPNSVLPLTGNGNALPGLDPAAPSDSRAWLAATARSRYPDLVVQIAAMFESERAGNIVFFGSPGWDFCIDDPLGGHGSILPEDIGVPMLFAGPGLTPGNVIPLARNCDLMPTLMALLGIPPVLPDGRPIDIDGINLLPCAAQTTGGGSPPAAP